MAAKLTKRELSALLKALKAFEVTWQDIYLFGSAAKGYATKDSDRDFCVVVPDGTEDIDSISTKLNGHLGYSGFNFDIIVTTHSNFTKNKLSPIMHEIRTTGVKVASA